VFCGECLKGWLEFLVDWSRGVDGEEMDGARDERCPTCKGRVKVFRGRHEAEDLRSEKRAVTGPKGTGNLG